MKAVLVMVLGVGLCLAQTVPVASPPIDSEFLQRAYKLAVKWDLFLRILAGCPLEDEITDPKVQCRPPLGRVDYKAFKEAREAAQKLFDLEDPTPPRQER